MTNPTPDVSSRYGAPMGRHGTELTNMADKIQLVRVRLNSGGYDAGGSYWGCGQPLFCAMDRDGNTSYLRAFDREAAKAKVLADYPSAKFFR